MSDMQARSWVSYHWAASKVRLGPMVRSQKPGRVDAQHRKQTNAYSSLGTKLQRCTANFDVLVLRIGISTKTLRILLTLELERIFLVMANFDPYENLQEIGIEGDHPGRGFAHKSVQNDDQVKMLGSIWM